MVLQSFTHLLVLILQDACGQASSSSSIFSKFTCIISWRASYYVFSTSFHPFSLFRTSQRSIQVRNNEFDEGAEGKEALTLMPLGLIYLFAHGNYIVFSHIRGSSKLPSLAPLLVCAFALRSSRLQEAIRT